MSGLELIEATDAHFAWMLGEAGPPDELGLPPGAIDEPPVLRWLRGGLARLGPRTSWLMVAAGEVVGLCGHKTAPDGEGAVEIGYGVAPERRRRGYATRAAALLVEAAISDGRLRSLVAETSAENLPSQRVLEANGFAKTGARTDPEDGEMILWRLALPR